MSSVALDNGTAAAASPAMPATLRALVTRVELLTQPSATSNNIVINDNNNSRSSASPTTTTVASTTELLRLVALLQAHYAALLALTERGFAEPPSQRTQTSPNSSMDTTTADAANNLRAETEQRMSQLESAVAALQVGIRSKIAQSSRLVLLNSLRREVAERRQCVVKMEGALSVARQHVHL